jgi:hypothetical protein
MNMEDITTNDQTPVEIGNHNRTINTLIFIEELNTLLAGDWDGTVIQYKVDPKNKTWSLVKEYGNLEINAVFSCVRVGDLIIFGGYEGYLFRVINFKTMEIIGEAYKTGIYSIYSLSLCKISSQQVLLSLSGIGHYYGKRSDILDITELLIQNKIDFNSLYNQKNSQFTSIKYADYEANQNHCHKCSYDSDEIAEKVWVKVEHYMNKMFTKLSKNQVISSSKSKIKLKYFQNFNSKKKRLTRKINFQKICKKLSKLFRMSISVNYLD